MRVTARCVQVCLCSVEAAKDTFLTLIVTSRGMWPNPILDLAAAALMMEIQKQYPYLTYGLQQDAQASVGLERVNHYLTRMWMQELLSFLLDAVHEEALKNSNDDSVHTHTHTHTQHNYINRPLPTEDDGCRQRVRQSRDDHHYLRRGAPFSPNMIARDQTCQPLSFAVSWTPSLNLAATDYPFEYPRASKSGMLRSNALVSSFSSLFRPFPHWFVRFFLVSS